MNVNGYEVCGKEWPSPSAFCLHSCGRSTNHDGLCWCGFCGGPQRGKDERAPVREDPPGDLIDLEGAPGPLGADYT